MSENKSKNIVIVALCITLIFMGVGFSLLSQQLTINGTASIDSNSSWDVEIASYTDSNDSSNNVAAIEAVDAKFAGATVQDLSVFNNASGSLNSASTPKVLGIATATTTAATFNVLLNEPGDYVVYKVRVENKGSIAAKLTAATISSPSPTDVQAGYVLNQNAEPAEEAMDIFTLEVVEQGNNSWDALTSSDLTTGASTLAAGSAEYYYVRIRYNDTHLTTPPASPYNTMTGSVVLTYTQANAS